MSIQSSLALFPLDLFDQKNKKQKEKKKGQI